MCYMILSLVITLCSILTYTISSGSADWHISVHDTIIQLCSWEDEWDFSDTVSPLIKIILVLNKYDM